MAEVKVKVTAQNETRTGFQQALNDAKQFGNEASKSASIDHEAALAPLRKLQQQMRAARAEAARPISNEDIAAVQGDEGVATTSGRASSAIRGLATDLANASSPAQVFEAILNRVSTAMGGLVAATAGFAIGSVIRRTLEDAAAGLNSLIDQSQELQQKFSDLSAPTTTFSQLTNAVQGAAAEIEALKKANEDLQSGFGFQVADYLSSYDLSSAANRETEGAEQNIRAGSTVAILAAMQRENELAKARTDEERALIGLQAERAKFREGAVNADPVGGGEAADRLFAAQDSRSDIDKTRDSAKAEASLQAQADKQRAINEDNRRSLEDRLAREKQGLADLEQFGGAGVELQREQAVSRIADLERQIATEKERAASKAKSTITAALQVTGLESVAQLKQALESVDAKTIQLALEATGLDSVEELQSALSQANNQTITAALQVTGLKSVEELRAALDSTDAKRVQVLFQALGLESIDEAKNTLDSLDAQARNSLDAAARKKRDTASQSLASAIEEREFERLSPAEQQAKIAADTASLINGIESGTINPTDAAQRALELARREDALAGATGGISGSAGASSLQRIGFARDEFFNTRSKKDPAEATEKAIKVLQEIKNALERGEPLVLNPT
jgi:hypothetical protein